MAAFVLVGGFAACARPTSAVYLGAWDGQATEWEVPPARMVTGPEAGVGSGGGGPGVGGLSGQLPACAKQGQGNCCYEEKAGAPIGFPKCGWQRLVAGESAPITAAFKDKQKVTLPVSVTLSGATQDSVSTYDDCVNATVGFVLSAAGIEEGALGGNVTHFALKADGTWDGQGGGGQAGLVAGRDPTASRDGPPPRPSYKLSDGLCKPLMTAGFTASIHVFTQVDFAIDGTDYDTDFAVHPNGQVTGYYVVLNKAF